MTETQALIADLEQAEEGGRELDERIAFQVRWRPQTEKSRVSFQEHERKHDYATAWIAHAPFRHEWSIPAYSQSIDAALPGENVWRVERSDNCCDDDGNEIGSLWMAHALIPSKTREEHKGVFAWAHTEALARRCAALRARLASGEAEG